MLFYGANFQKCDNYLSLPPTRQDLIQGQKLEGGDKGEGKVGNEPRLETCRSVLLIYPLSAMWV